MFNFTFNHSNYIIVGVITKFFFSTSILGILKVNVSHDLRHLELASPISDETLQTHSLSHLQHGMRNVFSPFPRHLLLCHSSSLTHICPLFHAAETVWDICCWCSVFTTTHVTYCKHGTKFLHLTVNCRLSDTAQNTEKGFLQVASSSEGCIRHKTWLLTSCGKLMKG